VPNLAGLRATRRTRTRTSIGSQTTRSYTIFEGTSEIQRLVIARSVSGLHIL
jgi:alkylation response protein AidB-like acyl-CoA dehydrogenase